jgi:hypothetical protein
MEQEKKVELDKNTSPDITTEENFRTIKGDLLQYNDDLTPRGYADPTITLTVAEDLKKFQRGIVKITIARNDTDGKITATEEYLFHIDGILSCIYSGYAKNLNVLRKPTLKQKAVHFQSKILNLIDRVSAALAKK